MILLYLLGFLAWAVPTAAGIWYLVLFREIHQEVKIMRRYLQSLHSQALRAEPGGSVPGGTPLR